MSPSGYAKPAPWPRADCLTAASGSETPTRKAMCTALCETSTGFVHELWFWLAFRDACTVGDVRWETSGTEGGPQVQTMGQPRRIECCAARRNSAT